jgi:hypothetical protein
LSRFHDEIALVNIQPHSSKTPTVPKERRRARRTALSLRADVTLPGDLTLEAHTIDISSTGLSCRVPYVLDNGQSCTVELDLTKFGSGRVEIQTVVRACRQNNEGKLEAGLEFVNAPEYVSELLRTLVR